ncbi:MAG: 30S ribosomal protein S24e [Desulfurococcaceae archaeon]
MIVLSKTIEIDEFTGEIVDEKYNPLIKRREIVLKISHIGKTTPSRGAIRVNIAKHYNVDVNRVIVKKIETEYGISVSKVYIHIYDDLDRLKKFEPEYIVKRNEQSLQLYELEKSQRETGSG